MHLINLLHVYNVKSLDDFVEQTYTSFIYCHIAFPFVVNLVL
jgi:hypothetical protein